MKLCGALCSDAPLCANSKFSPNRRPYSRWCGVLSYRRISSPHANTCSGTASQWTAAQGSDEAIHDRWAFMNVPTVRLTSLAHGGGCGCKLAPSMLEQLLADQPLAGPYRQLLVGTETPDDAAVWQLDDGTCVIATTDFFMPVVDDPYDFGRIAATNAISDVYAMGGKPIMALAILGIPLDKMAPETVREILKGGATVCAAAGIPVAGGHSIDAPEPIYGLAVIGI